MNHHRQRASALIITLMMIVLLTVLVLASFVRTQSSRQLQRSNIDTFLAHRYARDGVEQATALLRLATQDRTIPWSSQPGRIIRIVKDDDDLPVEEAIALHSGSTTSITTGVNLNAPLIQNPTEGVVSYPAAQEMPLAWLYLREDGTRSDNATYSASNKVIGRYAFWVDDETAKINLNTAWTPSTTLNPTYGPAHPSRIPLKEALSDLEDSDIATIQSYRATPRSFQTSLDLLKAFTTDPQNYLLPLQKAKFWTTTINSTPEEGLTFFGQPKIVLTTQANRALAADGTQLPYIDLNNLVATRNLIVSYLSRTDWPMASGESFQTKFYSSQPALLHQLAQNIIEYVKAKESSDDIIKPARFDITLNKVHAGPTRRPRLVEAGFWRNASDPARGLLYLVIHLPKNGGLTSFTMKDWRLQVSSNWPPDDIWLPDTTLQTGEYKLLARPCTVPTSGLIYNCYLKFFRYDNNNNLDMFDVYPTSSAAILSAHIPWPVTESPPSATSPGEPADVSIIQTIQISDPWLGGAVDDWSARGPNRFGQLTDSEAMLASTGLGSAPADLTLGQDLDHLGNLSDDGCIIPPPAGTPGNEAGYVESLAELGRIHTGIQIEGQPSVPFRTLRFQPRHPSATAHLASLPDWAILDLFALPQLPSEPVHPFVNRHNGRGGLVNLNTMLEPFPTLKRTEALMALLAVNSRFTTVERSQTADNITARTAADSTLGKGILNGSTYRFRGELAEVEGVSDRGEATEARLNRLIDLATTRSNTFAVWSIGQSVRQLPNGTLVPQGESRQLTYLERYETAAGEVKFRLLSSRPIGF